MLARSVRFGLLVAMAATIGSAGCAEGPAPGEPPLPQPAPPAATKPVGKKVQGPADLVAKPPRGGAAK
jgi:hypothetical protein